MGKKKNKDLRDLNNFKKVKKECRCGVDFLTNDILSPDDRLSEMMAQAFSNEESFDAK